MPVNDVRTRRVGLVDCMSLGAGPPLVLLPGLAPENCAPVGPMRSAEIQAMAKYADNFTVHWLGRPIGMRPGTTFAEMVAALASSLRQMFDEPVSVLGISTGGSFAQQLAAEHPDVVRRLVLISTGSRLDAHAAGTQREMIRIAEQGDPRRLMAAFAWDVLPRWRGRSLAAATMYVIGPRLYPGAGDLADVHATLVAEAGFDLRALPTIEAPSLIINGGKDRFYERSIVEETAALIPGSRLVVHPGRGHISVVSDRRTIREAKEFLARS